MISNGNERGIWSSKIGFILAGAGSAVGLGNIWRFPTVTAQYGGAAFVVIYLASVVLICLAVMIAELSLGRHTERNPVGAYEALAPGTPWRFLGMLGVLTGWGIASFYSVVAGWTLAYMFKMGTGAFSQASPEQIEAMFDAFVGTPAGPIAYHAVFMGLTMFILLGGVKSGIERWSKILMPILLFILVALVIRSVTLPGADAGLEFYLKPDWNEFLKPEGNLSFEGVVAAMGQAFFSLSLGMGTMITYGSYLSKRDNIVTSAGWVATLDTSIAILAGFVIMPAVFVFGLAGTEGGAGLIFQALPGIFNEIPFGNVVGTAFFLLLSIAALTSLISIVEVPTAYFIDELRWSRRKAVAVAGLGAFLVGTPAALYGGFLDFMNMVFGQYSLIIGSLGVAIFVGWKWGIHSLNAEIAAGYTDFRGREVLGFVLRFFSPIAIAALLLGLIFIPEAF